MKQFIVLAAVLPILLVFVVQATIDAERVMKMNAAEDAVRAFCVEASYYGGGGPAEAEALRSGLARILCRDASEIYVNVTQTDKAHIEWNVSFPVGEIMAGARLMGLTDAENRGRAHMSGTIVVAPPPPLPQKDADDADDVDHADDTYEINSSPDRDIDP